MRASFSRLRAETDAAVMSSERWARSRTAPRRDSAAIAASRLRVGMRSSNSPPPPRRDERTDEETTKPPCWRVTSWMRALTASTSRGRVASVSEAERSTLRLARPSEPGEPGAGAGATPPATVVGLAARRATRGRRRSRAAAPSTWRRGGLDVAAGVRGCRRPRSRSRPIRPPPPLSSLPLGNATTTATNSAARPAASAGPIHVCQASQRRPDARERGSRPGNPRSARASSSTAEVVGRAPGGPRAAAARARPARPGRARRGGRRARRRAPRARARRRG